MLFRGLMVCAFWIGVWQQRWPIVRLCGLRLSDTMRAAVAEAATHRQTCKRLRCIDMPC